MSYNILGEVLKKWMVDKSYCGWAGVPYRTNSMIRERRRMDLMIWPEGSWRSISLGRNLSGTEPLKPSSKVEETVCAMKEKAKEEAITPPPPPPQKKSLKQRFIDECVHYYHGSKLLFIDIKVSAKLLWRVLKGKQLTRREHKLVKKISYLKKRVELINILTISICLN